MENSKCKGMQDLLPDDMLRFSRVKDVFRRCCQLSGYREVRPPTLEYLHLFTATGTLTPGMLGKVYSFLDWNGWSGERVVLRPDGTIPVARLYIDNLSQEGKARLFYVTNIFAFEETGRENRERWQCGAEFFGGPELTADLEVLLLAEEVTRRLGLRQAELKLSHVGLVKALIGELGLSSAEEARITDRVLEGDWQSLNDAAAARPELQRLISSLLTLKGKSSSFLQNLTALWPQASPDFRESLRDFTEIATSLDGMGCTYEIDMTTVQGFEYYTGACFQLLVGGTKIGGGGRYDTLVPLLDGKDTPACGFALYVDPIIKLLSLEDSGDAAVLVRGKDSSAESINACFALAASLRDAGYAAELDFSEQKGPDYRRVVLVSGEQPSPYTLIDPRRKRRTKAASPAELLKLLQKE